MDYLFKKTSKNTLVAANDEAQQYLDTCKLGADVLVSPKVPRNYEFHKKMFALVKFAYNNVDHPEVFHNGALVVMDIDTFRSELIIRAGFRSVHVGLDSTVSLKADSIEYRKCGPAKAKRIYSGMLDVVSYMLYDSTCSKEEIEKLALDEQFREFL